jgi:branched-chain amino acid transport system ATP-binding protein
VTTSAPPRTVLLEARELSAGYGSLAAVRDLQLHVEQGEIVALLGPNGAGKTTTLRTLAGALRPLGGEVLLNGRPTRAPLHRRSRQGLAYVPEERSVFMGLTAAENLRVGDGRPERALELFPELRPHLKRRAGLLSGGQQQILTLARALASGPQVLLADELSLGLAPLIVARLLEAVREAANRGVGVLLVEQHAQQALAVADRVYVLQRGRIALEGPAEEIRGRLDELEQTYLAGPGPEKPGPDQPAPDQPAR